MEDRHSLRNGGRDGSPSRPGEGAFAREFDVIACKDVYSHGRLSTNVPASTILTDLLGLFFGELLPGARDGERDARALNVHK